MVTNSTQNSHHTKQPEET